MTPTGMVHALHETRHLLRRDGTLIDIHPLPEAWLAEVHRDGRVLFSQPWRDHDYCDEDVVHAEHALAQAVEAGVFLIQRQSEFDFLTYASSAAELREFLIRESAHREGSEEEADEAVKAELFARVEQVQRRVGPGAEVARRERVRITRLRSLPAAWSFVESRTIDRGPAREVIDER
ncbi:MAG: hypothetical protein ACRDG5_03355 [Anaerolineales bacterium]